MEQSLVMTNPQRINHIDPRVKLFHALIAGVLLFVVRSHAGVFLNVLFMVVLLVFLGLYRCASKLVICTVMLFGATKLCLLSLVALWRQSLASRSIFFQVYSYDGYLLHDDKKHQRKRTGECP